MDNFNSITNEFQKRMSDVFRKYDEAVAPKARYDEPEKKSLSDVDTQPLAPEDLPKIRIERWMVYSFSLPVRFSKKIAFGFNSKEEAQEYIDKILTKRDQDGVVIEKKIEVDDIEYLIKYDTIRDSVEEVNIYENPPEITTVGNDKETVLQEWID